VGTLLAQDGRQLDGIAHVALRVSDVARSRAFYKTLGWEQAFEFSDTQGTTTSYVKVSDRQYIELCRREKPAEPLGFMHICLEASGLDRLSAAYTAVGLTPTESKKGRAGNVLFNLRDPQDQLVEFTEYLPGSLHSNARGKFASETRLSDHMISVVVRASDILAEQAFFAGKLRFFGNGYKLGVPGNPAETIEIRPLTAGAAAEIAFAADPKRVAGELRKRGLDANVAGGAAEVRDPDGTVIRFTTR
jgi:catechol 2,3-dioxygenase-like lactoylglutathione lyase family enzyme